MDDIVEEDILTEQLEELRKARYNGDSLIIEGMNRVEENPFDEFITPDDFALVAMKIIEIVLSRGDFDRPLRVLDAGAGYGVWGKAIKQVFPEAFVTGVELQGINRPESYDEWFNLQDFLTFENHLAAPYDLVFGNPPFGITNGKEDKKLAEKFIRHAFSLLNPDGWVYFLLKSNYSHTIDRNKKLFQEFPIYWKFESISRIPFRKEKGNSTNNVEYSLFLFGNKQKRHKLDIPYVPTSSFSWKDGQLIFY